jgi:hypothetical protein
LMGAWYQWRAWSICPCSSSRSPRLNIAFGARLGSAAALATAAVLLGRPASYVLATARIHVAGDGRTVSTARGTTLAVPEYAEALVRGWAGRSLLPREWACDVPTTYLTLRLEAAQRHTGVRLIDPELPRLPPVAWHERSDPGAGRPTRVAD